MKSNSLIIIFLGFLMVGSVYAQDASDRLVDGICELANMAKAVLPSLIFLLVVVAAIVYAAGQLLSAEMRSRASVWATSMIVGAVMALIILIVVPIVLDALFSGDMAPSEACQGIY